MTDPETFSIRAADHTGLTVQSIDAVLSFWTEVMGLALLYRGDFPAGRFNDQVVGVAGAAMSTAMLQASGYKIELLQYHAPADRTAYAPRPCDGGSAHVAFQVSGLDALLARIADHGWQAQGEPQPIPSGPRAGTRVVYVRGPDAVTLELMEPSA